MFFFFNDTATTEIYTLSLHDALPIYEPLHGAVPLHGDDDLTVGRPAQRAADLELVRDRKSTRLNSSHANISYAVFCLKKKQIDSNSAPWICEDSLDYALVREQSNAWR